MLSASINENVIDTKKSDEVFWRMMHVGRTDWAMLLGSLFLLIRGGGGWSFDRVIYTRSIKEKHKKNQYLAD